MDEDQLEDLRTLIAEFQDDEQTSDRDMAEALRKILAEYAAAAR